jgi:hypothetical protein
MSSCEPVVARPPKNAMPAPLGCGNAICEVRVGPASTSTRRQLSPFHSQDVPLDAVVRRALTGHVTEQMQRHYSHVSLDEKRAAVAGVLRLVPPSGGDRGGDQEKSRRRQGRSRLELRERDRGFEPSTFSLGITDDERPLHIRVDTAPT